MKKAILILSAGLLLASCGSPKEGESNSNVDFSAYWTITFDSNGGSAIDQLRVKDGETASKPASDPVKEGYSFLSWYGDSYLTIEFDWNKPITADWTLYASYEKAETPLPATSESEADSESEDVVSGDLSSEEKRSAHGPEGSALVSWYLCGSGSLWGDDGWKTSGGVQLYSNPDNEKDKGCILSLAFEVDDIFKVTDGSTWYGYDKVSQESGGSVENKGKTNFKGDNDGYGGQNIKCTVAGTYDIYVNSVGSFWIQDAA